jgi:hypothetical protein
MCLRGALQICPKPLAYQLTRNGSDPVRSNRCNLFLSFRRLVRSRRSLDRLLTTLYARSANQEWVYKPVKERPRFWSEAGAMEQRPSPRGRFCP